MFIKSVFSAIELYTKQYQLQSILYVVFSCKDEKYQLLALSQVHAGRTLQAFLTLYYSSPADVQVKVTKVGSSSSLETSMKSVDGDGKFYIYSCFGFEWLQLLFIYIQLDFLRNFYEHS